MRVTMFKKMFFGLSLAGFCLAGCSLEGVNNSNKDDTGCNTQVDVTVHQVDPVDLGGYLLQNATVMVDSLGNQIVNIYLNAPLSDETLTNMANTNDIPILVDVREVLDPIINVIHRETFGFYLKSIGPAHNLGEYGIHYQLTGDLRNESGEIVYMGILGGDRLVFNTPYNMENANDEDIAFPYKYIQIDLWDNLLSWNTKIPYFISANNGKTVESYPENLQDWAVVQFIPASDKLVCLD